MSERCECCDPVVEERDYGPWNFLSMVVQGADGTTTIYVKGPMQWLWPRGIDATGKTTSQVAREIERVVSEWRESQREGR